MGLSFSSNYLLNKKLEDLPTDGPKWHEHSFKIEGDKMDEDSNILEETIVTYMRDPVEVVAALLNNPEFREGMTFAPEHAYVDPGRKTRLFDDMWTGDEWHRVQVSHPYEPRQ